MQQHSCPHKPIAPFNITSSFFYYDGRKFTIIQHASKLKLFQYDYKIPFLYSGKQELNIDEDIDIYEFKLKIGEYHNENLLMEGDFMQNFFLR